MRKITRRALTSAVLGLMAVAPAAQAGPTTSGSSIVSLGDSYISGEAGRWNGNSINPAGSRDGTDRAFTGTGYDTSRVYLGGSDANGCHRSDVAEIRSARAFVNQKINLACSGAVTKNIFRARNGGEGQKGELPQGDQLDYVARVTNVKSVVLSIGGNDLGFASIISACLQAYETMGTPCRQTQQPLLDSRFPTANANVSKAIDEVRSIMSEAGYSRSQYRFVVQSYPSVIPRAAEIRVPEIDRNARTNIDGCPLYDTDANWARDSVVNQIANNLKFVAISKGTQFLDLRNAYQGREVCAKTTRLATPTAGPSSTTSEWGRFLNLAAVNSQGKLQETVHPNAYGQRALGDCLTRLFLQAPTGGTSHSCTNTPGAGPESMVLRAG